MSNNSTLDALSEKIAWRVAEILNDMAAASVEKRAGAQPASHGHLFAIAEAHAIAGGITLSEILGPCRIKRIVEVRQGFMLAAHEAGYSTPEIGRALNGRDHTTVLHGIQRARKRAAEREAAE